MTISRSRFSMPISVGAAFLLTLVVCKVLALYPHNSITQFLCNRGWIQIVILYSSILACCLLITKYRQYAREKQTFQKIVSRALPAIADKAWLSCFLEDCKKFSRSITERIKAVIECYLNHGEAKAKELMTSQSQLHARSLEQGDSHLSFLLWAIPLLGFLGTVQGLGVAIFQFGASLNSNVNLEAVKQSLGNVVGGLGTAFDTTFLGLVASLVIGLIYKILQKWEALLEIAFEDFLINLIYRFPTQKNVQEKIIVLKMHFILNVTDFGEGYDNLPGKQKSIDSATSCHDNKLHLASVQVI